MIDISIRPEKGSVIYEQNGIGNEYIEHFLFNGMLDRGDCVDKNDECKKFKDQLHDHFPAIISYLKYTNLSVKLRHKIG